MFPELLEQKLAGIVSVSPEQIHRLEYHYQLLLKWNSVLNLTRVDALEEAVERHYCESLFLAAHLPPNAVRIVDVGSGAGFPGFPVAVLRPDCSVTLVESHTRKAVFLREASRGLLNVHIVAQRAETLSEKFDHIISRAVSYSDLASVLRTVATHAELLTGSEAPPAELGFVWKDAIPLPWGRQRFLRIGVSRET